MIAEGSLIDGRYRLDQPIGHGRAGIVWLAFDTRLHRTVAAKRMYVPHDLEPARTADAKAVALREGRAACRIVHNHALTAYEAVSEGADVWLIMEYVPSRSMDEFLNEYGRLTVEQTAALGAQLASALMAAHALGIAHGALEPGNVLLADDGGIKITDIGLSKPEASPAYRAPELVDGVATTAPGPASDAFSLGATLYTAVEGIPPFGTNGTDVQAPPHHAGTLTGTLLKLLRTEADTRPTLQDTVAALRAISTGNEPASAPPDTPATPSQTPGAPRHLPPQRTRQVEQSHQPTPVGAQTAAAAHSQPSAASPPARSEPVGRSTRSPVRAVLVISLAVLLAIAVGVAFTEFVLL